MSDSVAWKSLLRQCVHSSLRWDATIAALKPELVNSFPTRKQFIQHKDHIRIVILEELPEEEQAVINEFGLICLFVCLFLMYISRQQNWCWNT